MRYVFAAASRRALRQFANTRLLLGFDYDGTLAPIVPEPDKACMRLSTHTLLQRVAQLYPCIVLSGRAREDVMHRVNTPLLQEVIGNHGIEPWSTSDRIAEQVQRWSVQLEEQLEGIAGIQIENKRFSIAVHYRQSPDKKRVRATILETAKALDGVRIIGGKQLLNILPARAPNKGIALTQARARLQCDNALYVGDDETDEDIFGLEQLDRLLSIRVGKKRETAASYYIHGQREIDRLLRELVELRQSAPVRTPR